VIRPHLSREIHALAAQGPPGPQAAPPDPVETLELPDGIHSQTSRLDRIAGHVALEIPGVDLDIFLRHDSSPLSVRLQNQDAVDHQEWRGRQAGIETGGGIGHELSIRKCDQLG